MVYTQFMDMHSGGGQKLKWKYIYIEASLKEAKIIFQNKFKRNPERVTCTCCGGDYSISESKDLEQASAYERRCKYQHFDKEGNEIDKDKAWISGKGFVNECYAKYIEKEDREEIDDMKKKYPDSDWEEYKKYIPLKDYKKKKDILVITKKIIKAEWRKGELKEEGYVWK